MRRSAVLSFLPQDVVAGLDRRSAAQAPAPPRQPAAAAPKSSRTTTRTTASWLCRPGRKGDACDVDLTTTVVAADGTLTRETFAADPKAPIDCFYVYPTVSTDATPNSDMSQDPAEKNVVLQQFARFASKCRAFAPMYRQITLRGLQAALATNADPLSLFSKGVQYDDVRDAWQHYLKNDNQGRGVVLIGHSQGAFILQALIANEIDGKPVQKQLVGAYILGATFLTPKGKDVGGQFKQIPLCKQARPDRLRRELLRVPLDGDAAGEHAVRPQRRSGVVRELHESGDARRGQRAAARVSVGERQDDRHGRRRRRSRGRRTRPSTRRSSACPGLLTAECKTNEFATYLEIKVNGDPADPRVDDITGDLGAAGKPHRAVGPALDRRESRDGQPARSRRGAVEGVSLAALTAVREHREAGRDDAAPRIVGRCVDDGGAPVTGSSIAIVVEPPPSRLSASNDAEVANQDVRDFRQPHPFAAAAHIHREQRQRPPILRQADRRSRRRRHPPTPWRSSSCSGPPGSSSASKWLSSRYTGTLTAPPVTICDEPATTFQSATFSRTCRLIGVRRIVVHDRRVVVAIDVDRRREGDERIALLGYFEGGEDASLGRAEADDPRGLVLGRERQEVVGVDRELRAFLRQEVERRLPDHFAIAAGRRHLEANARRAGDRSARRACEAAAVRSASCPT